MVAAPEQFQKEMTQMFFTRWRMRMVVTEQRIPTTMMAAARATLIRAVTASLQIRGTIAKVMEAPAQEEGRMWALREGAIPSGASTMLVRSGAFIPTTKAMMTMEATMGSYRAEP